jgi:hypothetical protein
MGSEKNPFNPKRRLCPDGTCIGIIGKDGRCTICQSADSGEEPAFLAEDLIQDATPTPTVQPNFDSINPAVPPTLHRRRLCDDGTCIGILDSNGVCGTCGKPAANTLATANPSHEQEPSGTG